MDAISPPIITPWLIDAHVDRLKASWQHYSASQIARLLSDEFGITFTRNAVIGKIHRLGLTGEQKPRIVLRPKRDGKPRSMSNGTGGYRMMQSIETDMEPLREAQVEPPLKLTLLERQADQCHFPTVYESEWLYCGHPTSLGRNYCAGHLRVMYVPPQQRRRSTVPSWR